MLVRVSCAGQSHLLQWTPSESNITEHGMWTCQDRSVAAITQTTLQPCVAPVNKCCHATSASPGLHYTSSLWDQSAVVTFTYEVWPACGDGVKISFIRISEGQQKILYSNTFQVTAATPQREHMELTIALLPGDQCIFLVEPGNSHDCDGVYLHELTVWPTPA